MKVIVAGCRHITDYDIVLEAIAESEFNITEVVSGKALGVDKFGELYADENQLPVKPFPADWKNLDVPNAVIKTNRYGKYNAAAGHNRNEQMAEYADALIAVWDGKSTGTRDMIGRAMDHNLKLYVHYI